MCAHRLGGRADWTMNGRLEHLWDVMATPLRVALLKPLLFSTSTVYYAVVCSSLQSAILPRD